MIEQSVGFLFVFVKIAHFVCGKTIKMIDLNQKALTCVMICDNNMIFLFVFLYFFAILYVVVMFSLFTVKRTQ